MGDWRLKIDVRQLLYCMDSVELRGRKRKRGQTQEKFEEQERQRQEKNRNEFPLLVFDEAKKTQKDEEGSRRHVLIF